MAGKDDATVARRARGPRLELAQALGQSSADKRLDILRRVGEGGSISQAARDAGVSYKAAWQALDTLSNLAGAPLVERSVGGAGGGGARLTEAAEHLLRASDEIARAREQVLARLRGPAAGARVASALALRTSMRNQLPCEVRQVEAAGPLARVHLALVDGTPLASRITTESAQLLGLRPGLPVVALCKAMAVSVSRAIDQGATAANQWMGKVRGISRGALGDEVSVQLTAGLQLVAFAPARSGLRSGSPVVSRVDETAVVIAVL